MLRIVEREARVYRRLWRGSVFSTFLIPVLFLVAVGQQLGGMIDERATAVDGLSYLHFFAPGLLAGMAMQSSAPMALWPVMAGTKWVRFFHGVVATPVSAAELYGGYIMWCAIRATLAATAFVAVAAVFGGIPSAWGILAIPAAGLCATAFCAVLAAFAATQSNDISFGVLIRLVIMPLFLFSGTFFPVSQLPGWLEAASRFSPLWHAVELCRSATTGHAELGAVVLHVGVLVGIVIVGWLWGTRSFTRKLAQ